MRGEHQRQVVGGHLVAVLFLGRLVEEIQQKFEKVPVGGWEEEEEELQSFHLPLFIRGPGAIPLLIEEHQI